MVELKSFVPHTFRMILLLPHFPLGVSVSVMSGEDFTDEPPPASHFSVRRVGTASLFSILRSLLIPSLSSQIGSKLIFETTAQFEVQHTDHVVACQHWKSFPASFDGIYPCPMNILWFFQEDECTHAWLLTRICPTAERGTSFPHVASTMRGSFVLLAHDPTVESHRCRNKSPIWWEHRV